ncbi:MAG TPA: PLP-dependent aminotransferase family protein [Candidatus Limnocylindria bacterium]|nr:PLP-dependent aminotransferase family protein [Candidatus Limnocylindria bacterium]
MTVVTPSRLAELLGEWRRGGPAAERLAATLRALVLDGRIPLQSRLPAERRLAVALGLSRATVTAAYDRLRAEGYIASRQGSASVVTIPGGHRTAPDPIYQADGLDLRIAALPAPALLAELAQAAVRELPRWLDHHGYDPLGLPPLRTAIAARFTARGLPTAPEQILVTSGALQALDLSIRALLPRGRAVLTEIPSYPVALDALRTGGARLRTVPVTAEGWDVRTLEVVAREHGPALAYLMPDFQNPTGALIDEPTRVRAMRALGRAGTVAIVDETFAELSLDARALPMPLAGVGGGQTVTIGSLSKSVWGGLRVGWARAEPLLIRRLAAARATVDMASPVLEQLLAVEVLRCFDEIIAERRALLRDRRQALTASLDRHLPEWSYTRPAGGMFLWAELPDAISTSLSVLAAERGIALTPGPRFGAAGLLERYIRLPYCLAPDQLERAVSTLAQAAGNVSKVGRLTETRLEYVA